jgi:hypothetical protein
MSATPEREAVKGARWRRVGRLGAAALLLPALMVTAVLGLARPAHAAGPATFKWTGAAAMATTPNANWSDGANWLGGVAPAAPGPVDMVFPPLVCATSVLGCGESNNDITGLTVAKLTIDSAENVFNQGSYFISGNGVTLDALTANAPGGGFLFAELDIPITLGQAQTWVIDGANIGFFDITGPFPLTLSLFNQAQPSILGTVSVTSLTAVGKDANDVGIYAYANGYLDLQQASSINAPVSVTRAELSGFGGALASLTTSAAAVSVGGVVGPGNNLPVGGTATLDKGSIVYFENLAPGKAGDNYPEMTATGSSGLNGAGLYVSADCGQALGTVYKLVDAAGGLTGNFTQDLELGTGPIVNNEIIPAQAAYDGSCTGSNSPPYLQYKYNRTKGIVTVTVVAAPPGASSSVSARHDVSHPRVVSRGARAFAYGG